MNCAILRTPFFDSLFKMVNNVSKFDSKIGKNCSKIEKWNDGVRIFLIGFHFVSENYIPIIKIAPFVSQGMPYHPALSVISVIL